MLLIDEAELADALRMLAPYRKHPDVDEAVRALLRLAYWTEDDAERWRNGWREPVALGARSRQDGVT